MTGETSKFSFVKVRGADGRPTLYPGDERAEGALGRIKHGQEVIVTIKAARRPKQHRAFFAILEVVVEAGVFQTTAIALLAVKVATGEVDDIIDGGTGQVFHLPRSISFESMDQIRFSELFETTLNIVCDRWLVGTNVEYLRNRVLDIVEDKRTASLGTREPRRAVA